MSYKFSIFNFQFSIIILFFLFSCEDKTVDYGLDRYYEEIVTAQNENDFLLDNGKMIFATSDENRRTFALGDRVYVNYTLLTSTASVGNDSVRINSSFKIPLGKLTLTNDSVINSTAKEPILLESVWLGSHYLNMQFYLNFRSVNHSVGLLVDSVSLKNDTIRMFFVHDSNNDPPGYPAHTFLSFDLKEVLGDNGNSRPISVRIHSSNYGNKNYEFAY